MNRVVGLGSDWTAWYRGATDRRPKRRDGTDGGLVMEVVVVEEKRRLERKIEAIGLRAVAVAMARARV